MSAEFAEQPKIVEEPEEKLMIQIFLHKSGGVRVQGSIITDPMAFFGLMEIAKQSVFDHLKKISETKIIKGNGGIMNFARRLGR